uniref:Uncharacterized protein n=1 Tax=Oryza sativa subsp. japonica TaxID=39947 RepID=Q2QX19_ORYSJ|nr:hypothetical protein LOC_Os12g07470 [Oryza sativa Japonica Group]
MERTAAATGDDENDDEDGDGAIKYKNHDSSPQQVFTTDSVILTISNINDDLTCRKGGPGATASSIPEFPTQPPGETRHEIDAEFTGKAL